MLKEIKKKKIHRNHFNRSKSDIQANLTQSFRLFVVNLLLSYKHPRMIVHWLPSYHAF